MRLAALVLLALLAPAAAHAEMRLPPGFSAEVYVTGSGEAPDGRAAVGIPSTTSLAFDAAGMLYTARSGRRYRGGEIEDLWPLFRFPAGGARVTGNVARYFYGPPLLNLQLLAGGTPPPGEPPLFKQPEGVALDAAGNIYVADRQHGAVMKLDPAGRVLDPRWLTLSRPRLLAARGERVWVAADGDTEAPWLSGTGEIWVIRGQERRVALSGPIVAGMDVSPGGHLVVADRHGARILAVGGDGTSIDIVTFSDGERGGRASRATSSSSSPDAARGRSTRSSASRGPSTS